MSPRTVFYNELRQLKENVTGMAQRATQNYERLFESYEKKDEEELRKIIAIDKEINKKQREIESQCLFLITKQQPIVSDLRVVTASLKVVTDIERVGDHVADMAELLLRLNMKELSGYSAHLLPMIDAAKEMILTVVSAFVDRDQEAAQEVIRKDDEVDELLNQVKTDVIESLKKEAGDVDELTDILMIAKYLEKIGDHAVNIGEWEIFQETGNIRDMRLL